MKIQEISKLTDITFYTGSEAEESANAVELREYGYENIYFGKLEKTKDNNSKWTNSDSIFIESETQYSNIGDVMSASLAYINKFNNVTMNADVNVKLNELNFNYKFESDLKNSFNTVSTLGNEDLQNFLLSVNDNTFNKQHYYGGEHELQSVIFTKKQYDYQPKGTIVKDTSNSYNVIEYNFGNSFTSYTLNSIEETITYIAETYLTQFNPKTESYVYIPTGHTYESYYVVNYDTVTDIIKFSDKMHETLQKNVDKFMEEYGELATYYISNMDTVIAIGANTYSVAKKNIYAYFNYESENNDWFNYKITFNSNGNDELVTVHTKEAGSFNCIKKDEPIDISTNINLGANATNTFNGAIGEYSILSPSKLDVVDFSNNLTVTSIDMSSDFDKRVTFNEYRNTNWINETGINIDTLIVGSEDNTDYNVESIHGLNKITTLKSLDITNCNKLTNLNIKQLDKLSTVKAKGSSIKTFIPHANNEFINIELPETIQTLILDHNKVNAIDFTPSEKLVNLTLDTVTGIDTKLIVNDWIDALTDSNLLYDGIITNTSLKNINWIDEPVEPLLKLRYVGLKDFTGTVAIKGSAANDNLTRKEYMDLRYIYGEEIMEVGQYKGKSKKPIKFVYTLDPKAFNKNVLIYYYQYENDMDDDGNIFEIEYKLQLNDYLNEIVLDDKLGSHSLLNYLEESEDDEYTFVNDNTLGYCIKLSKMINTDNISVDKQTKNITAGDILLYKGNQLIIAHTTKTALYNYVKLGKLVALNPSYRKITLKLTDVLPSEETEETEETETTE